MTQSQQLAEKIKTHILTGGTVRFANYAHCMFLTAKHAPLVHGSSREVDNGVYVQSGKRKDSWLASCIAFSKAA